MAAINFFIPLLIKNFVRQEKDICIYAVGNFTEKNFETK